MLKELFEDLLKSVYLYLRLYFLNLYLYISKVDQNFDDADKNVRLILKSFMSVK